MFLGITGSLIDKVSSILVILPVARQLYLFSYYCFFARSLDGLVEFTVRKKRTTDTFTYDALRTNTLKERTKTQRKIVNHLNSTRAMLLV